MKLTNLTYIVTDNCNFDCVYCPQKKEPKNITTDIIDKSAAFFRPYMEENAYVIFYGGEPLLVFDLLEYTVALMETMSKKDNKKSRYSLTTNGTLLNADMLAFFNQHRFMITLSYDGLAHDANRRTGTAADTLELIPRFRQYPGIDFSINSVFTPDSIGTLTESVKQMVTAGAPGILYNLNNIEPWDEAARKTLEQELEKLGEYMAAVYRETGTIPLENFRPPASAGTWEENKKPFVCSAGHTRISISPDGAVWGCQVFPDFFKGKEDSGEYKCYAFGALDRFIENFDIIYPGIMENYWELRQDFFYTEEGHCFLCGHVNDCSMCPVTAAQATGEMGKIPLWSCKVKTIQRWGKYRLLKAIS